MAYQAILFPCDSDTPQLIKVDCLARPQATGPCKWTPLVGMYIGGQREPGSVIVTRGVGGAGLRFPLQIFYRADFLVDGSAPNRSINRLTGGHATHQWNGNVIALKFFGNRRQGYVLFPFSSSRTSCLVTPRIDLNVIAPGKFEDFRIPRIFINYCVIPCCENIR